MAIILVTGCSSGFGEAIALAFARRSDTVIATMRNPASAPTGLRDHASVEIATLDVTDAQSRDAIISDIMTRHGRIDVLVNNAGIGATASIEDTSEELMRKVFETNFFAPVALMQAVLPIMRAQGAGRIINVTAIGAILSTPLFGAYAAAKHALDSAAAIVDLEGRPFGIRAPSVLPGQFKTSIADKAPSPIVTRPYQPIADALTASREARAADVQTDLSQVVNAVVIAATDANPKPRYLAGLGIALELEASITELERLHAFEADRSGVA